MDAWVVRKLFAILVLLFACLPCKWAEADSGIGRVLTSDEETLLSLAKVEILKFLANLESDSAQLVSCFSHGICPKNIVERLATYREVISSEVQKYRRLTGLYRIERLKRGDRSIAPFLTATERLLFSNQESVEIFKIAASDYAAAEKVRTRKLSRSDVQLFYQLQLEHQLNRFPFLAYLTSERPTDEELSRALQKVYLAAHERSATIEKWTGEQLKQLVVYRPFLEGVLILQPRLRTAYETLLGQPSAGVFGLSKSTENLIVYSYLGCVGFFLLAPGWPVGVACTTISILSNAGNVIESWRKYEATEEGWLSGLQSFQELRDQRNQLTLSAVSLAVMGYTWYPVVGMIKGPLLAALEQTAVQTAQRIVSASALKSTAVALGQSVVKVQIRTRMAYLLLKDASQDASQRSETDRLVPVSLGDKGTQIYIEADSLFKFSDLLRVRDQLPKALNPIP